MKQGILLCVDDERVILDALHSQLRATYGTKHLIEVAESAEEGLDILDDLQCDGYLPLVIISDWLMPGMKGDEFLIEAHKKFPYVIKVLLSGQANEDAIERTRESAALYEFIAKPWSASHLIECIDSGLKQFYKIYEEKQLNDAK